MKSVRLERLDADDLPRISEVDRAERVEAEYLARPTADGRGLALKRVALDPALEIPTWSEYGVEVRVREWRPQVEAGGVFEGAFLDSKLVGFGVLGPERDASAEVCALFVDAGQRRAGVGGLLMARLEELARERGVRALWLGSNRTASSVEFYLKHGFGVISLNSNALVAHRPGDPVFAKSLD